MTTSSNSKSLFGGDKPWSSSDWTSSDDRIRGGSSQSHLLITTPPTTATFTGTLDTKTLGGAGFASQRTTTVTPFDLSGYDGLRLDILSSESCDDGDKMYTLTLKDEMPERRRDGREQSTISWEYDFSAASTGRGKSVYVGWDDFKATYRGRDVEDPPKGGIKVGEIRRLGLMMRSFFDKQDGPFELVVSEIAAFKGARESFESFVDEKVVVEQGLKRQGWLAWALSGCGF